MPTVSAAVVLKIDTRCGESLPQSEELGRCGLKSSRACGRNIVKPGIVPDEGGWTRVGCWLLAVGLPCGSSLAVSG